MRFFYLLLLAVTAALPAFSSNPIPLDTPVNSDSPQKAAAEYIHSADTYAALFTGKEHEKYPLSYINHPWFKSSEYTKGMLYVANKVYPDVQLKLDLFRDELVISPQNSPYNIVTSADSAHLYGSFIHYLPPAYGQTPTGYAVVLHNGSHKLYLKYQLIQRQVVESGRVVNRFETFSSYWLRSGNEFYKISKLSDLYPHFQVERRTIRHFLHEHQLNFRKNPETTLSQLMKYLDQQ